MRRRQLRDKDFLAELQAYAAAQRQLIEAECDGFDPDPAARDVRATRAHDDFRFFARTYFPHYIKGDESAFHTWFYDNVPTLLCRPGAGALINLSAPRGEAKSTLGTQLLNLWLVITGRRWFIPIVMDAFDQSVTMLEAIKVELTDNPRLAMDFPDAVGAGRVWQVGVILTRNGRKLQAFGARKRMRGLRHGPHRPDHVSLDDIENDENVLSPDQRVKGESWVLKTVLNLGPPDGSMSLLYLNTILHHDSVANRFHKKPRWVRRKFRAISRWPDRMDLWQEWERLFLEEQSSDLDPEAPVGVGAAQAFYEANRAEMERGAVVSWPSTRPLLRLMEIRAESHHAFDCEYQNDPVNEDAAWFSALQYWVQPIREWVFYGSHDPSLGRLNKKRDPSACLVGGFDKAKGKLDVVEARIARIPPERQIANIIEYQREYQCRAWAFEAVQFQEFMRTQLVAASAAQGVPVPALPVQPHTDKDLRIQGMSPHVFNGLIRSHARHTVLNDQLRHYPEAEHDDGPDALEMLWKIALAGAGGVPRIRLGKPRK